MIHVIQAMQNTPKNSLPNTCIASYHVIYHIPVEICNTSKCNYMYIPYSKKLWRSKSLAKKATAKHWRKKLWRKSMCRFRAIIN